LIRTTPTAKTIGSPTGAPSLSTGLAVVVEVVSGVLATEPSTAGKEKKPQMLSVI